MKRWLLAAAASGALVAGVDLVSAQAPQVPAGPPAWAFPLNPPGFALTPDDGRTLRVPDSAVTFKVPQVRDAFFSPDWHPGDHPPMPDVVATGRRPDVRACGYCHRASGPGGAENASLTGLPAAYIIQQLADFKSGARKGSLPQRVPLVLMIATAKGSTDAENAAAAAYFASLPPRKLYTVTESDTAPKTDIYNWAPLVMTSGEKEPLGKRIVEVPEDSERFEARDSRVGFKVFAPVGSLAKGETIVKTGGGGKFAACGTCHGADLKGLGPIPPIAGRSPTYMFRQLYDFQHGERMGPWSPLMASVVTQMSEDEMIAVVAYLASRDP
jgi:cytochrome c553